MQIKRPDFEFMLNIFGADKSADLDFIEINQILLNMANKYEKKFVKQFAAKGQLSQFDEEDD